MSPVTAGIAGIILLIVLMLLRLPVAFTMASVGVAGFMYLSGPTAAFGILSRDIFDQFASYPLSVIPMFILMGCFAFASGISRRLYDTAYKWVGQLRGGLTIATVLACAGFAAICGSTAATAATMGKVALPEMKKYGYNDTLATGTVAAAGTLGILIPPSTVLLVYGLLTEQSIGKLFVAGILPGVLLSIFFVITVLLICLRNPASGPPGAPTTWRQKWRSLNGIFEAAL
ncbi:MAG TPA: TRAP transporter large permease subunit, partial [Dehalococcoidia bacterium]|nr:TRAP transporter large permease subunit [Dehalococcoidia bacterium]